MFAHAAWQRRFCALINGVCAQVQEVAAHLNVHLPVQEGDDAGSMTSRRKPPPTQARSNLTAITLKNHPLSLPMPPPKPISLAPAPAVVDDFGAPACAPPPANEAEAVDVGGGALGGARRPQGARRAGAGALGGRKIVERYFLLCARKPWRLCVTVLSPIEQKSPRKRFSS